MSIIKILFGITIFSSVALAAPPSASDIDGSCKWYSRRAASIHGDLGAAAGSGQSCVLTSALTVCSGYLDCTKDFADMSSNGVGRGYLRKGINNPVACVTSGRCEDVSASKCYLDKLARPNTDFMDTVIYSTDAPPAAQPATK